MAGDVTTSVTAVISVVDKATPAIDDITKSLDRVGQVAKQASGTVARSIQEQRAEFEKAGLLKPPPWAKIHEAVPDVAPAITEQVEQVKEVVAKLDQPMASMGDKLRASIARTFSDLGKRAGDLGAAIKGQVGGAFESLAAIAARVSTSLKGFFTGIGGFLTGAAVMGAVKQISAGLDAFAKRAQALGEKARGLGVTVEEFQGLERWARDANLPVGTMEKNLGRLNRTIGQVAAGKNKAATELLADLGVNVTEDGKLRPFLDIVRDLADAIARMPTPAQQAAAAFALIGQNYAGMVDAMRGGAADIDRAITAQEQVGVITDAQVKQVADYQKAVRGIAEQWRGVGEDFRSAIGEAAMPILTPVLQELETWLRTSREGLKENVLTPTVQGIATAFKTLAEYVKSSKAELQAFVEYVQPLTTKLADVWKGFGLPEIQISADPITQFRDAVVRMVTDLEGMFAGIATKIDAAFSRLGTAIKTPLLDAWAAALEKIRGIWEAIAKAVERVATAYQTATGLWNRFTGSTPPTLPAAPPPQAVSTGGGPLTWENLAGPRPGDLLGAAGGQPANGTVNVVIENKNAPPGQRTTARATGAGVRTQVDTGTSMPWSVPAYSGPWAPAGA